ncbi:MAG: putative extracellular nuclease [Pirellulaceae bacterium]|jgi:predicted extracellular nuclease
MKIRVPLLLAFTILIATLAWPTCLRAERTVRIGSWNIENLGDRYKEQQPAQLARHLATANVDVLALQEIWDDDGDDSKMCNTTLNAVFAQLNEEPNNDWHYILFPKRDPSELKQHCGVAWNRGKVKTVGKPLKIDVQYANEATWKRHPYAVKFSAGQGMTDFVVIPLHMKSNYTVAGLPPTEELRKAEATALIQKLGSVFKHFHDEDVVILGDLNCLNASEPGVAKYVDFGFRDLNRTDTITYVKSRDGAPFDRLLVPRYQPEFKYATQYGLAPGDRFDHVDKLSDHMLIFGSFRVMQDDD